MPVAIVTDTTHYMPRELSRRTACTRSASTSTTAASRSARPTCRTSTRSTSACAPRASCRRRRSPRSATSSRSTSRSSRGPRHRLGPHRRRDLRHRRVGAPGGRGADARAPAAPHRGHRLAQRVRRASASSRWPRAAAARDGGDVDAVAARVRDGGRGAKIWFAVDTLEFLRRGGRIGAAPGLARRRAEDQADPHGRGRDHADRARAHRRGARSSGWSSSCAPATTTAATPGSSSTSRPPSRPSAGRAPAARSSAREPVFVSEIGPVIGTHVGPGLLGVGGHGPARCSS